MIVKRSVRNQVAIPKKLIEAAGLGERDTFFDIEYRGGSFILRPLEFSERISREALERFKARTLKPERGDRAFSSMKDVIAALGKKRRR